MNGLPRAMILSLGCLVAVAIPATAPSQDIETARNAGDGFVHIFDGQTLDGWHVTPDTCRDDWFVENGILVGQGNHGRCYLVWKERDLADFELKFRYRFPGEGNSGINLRAVEDPTGKRDFQAYHADLGHVGIGKNVLGAWDFHTPGRIEHGCPRGQRLVIDVNDRPTYTVIDDALTLDDIHRHDWNDVHLIVRGNHFRFMINGKVSSEFTEHLDAKRRLHRGMLQLQLHDPGMVVHFKDILLKVLP